MAFKSVEALLNLYAFFILELFLADLVWMVDHMSGLGMVIMALVG